MRKWDSEVKEMGLREINQEKQRTLWQRRMMLRTGRLRAFRQKTVWHRIVRKRTKRNLIFRQGTMRQGR